MTWSSGEYSTKHPHEPETAPIYDSEGRCLICRVSRQADALRAQRDDQRAVVEELKAEVERLATERDADHARAGANYRMWKKVEAEAERLRDRVEGLAERCERNGSKPWVEFAAALRVALEPALHPSEEKEPPFTATNTPDRLVAKFPPSEEKD